jgi:hypothetical protein
MKAAQQAGTVENYAQGYQDFLQAPLQVSPSYMIPKAKLDCISSHSWTIYKVQPITLLSRIP